MEYTALLLFIFMPHTQTHSISSAFSLLTKVILLHLENCAKYSPFSYMHSAQTHSDRVLCGSKDTTLFKLFQWNIVRLFKQEGERKGRGWNSGTDFFRKTLHAKWKYFIKQFDSGMCVYTQAHEHTAAHACIQDQLKEEAAVMWGLIRCVKHKTIYSKLTVAYQSAYD